MVPAPLNSCPVCALCKGGWSAFYICPENISFSNSHKSGYVGYCQALQSRSHTLHFPVFQYCLENPSSHVLYTSSHVLLIRKFPDSFEFTALHSGGLSNTAKKLLFLLFYYYDELSSPHPPFIKCLLCVRDCIKGFTWTFL